MALVLDFSVCQSSDCTEFTFSDNTGAYNATTNPYGWGAPNVALADVQTPVTLDITTPGGSTFQIDLILTTPAFPVDQPPNELVVDMSSLGGTAGDPFPDGIYTFVYSVSTIFGDYSQTITVAFYCQVQCCVYSMFNDLNPHCDCCDDDRNTLINAYLMFKGLIYAANCGNVSEFNSVLAQLQKICTQSNCSQCR